MIEQEHNMTQEQSGQVKVTAMQLHLIENSVVYMDSMSRAPWVRFTQQNNRLEALAVGDGMMARFTFLTEASGDGTIVMAPNTVTSAREILYGENESGIVEPDGTLTLGENEETVLMKMSASGHEEKVGYVAPSWHNTDMPGIMSRMLIYPGQGDMSGVTVGQGRLTEAVEAAMEWPAMRELMVSMTEYGALVEAESKLGKVQFAIPADHMLA